MSGGEEDEFQIPLGGSDSSHDDSSVFLAEQDILSRLEDCKSELNLGDISFIHKWFSLLHHVVNKFGEVGVAVNKQCWDVVLQELQAHRERVANFDMSPSEKSQLRNATKKLYYIAVNLAGKFETEAFQEHKGNKKTKLNSWNEQRLKFMTLLAQVYDCNLVQLWESSSVAVMEDFSTLLTSACYKFLENPTAVRDKLLLETMTKVLGLAVTKYGMTLSVALKLTQLLQHFDHLVNPITYIVSTTATTRSFLPLAVNMLREITSREPVDLAMDAGGTKSLATFLASLSCEVPAAVLPVVPALLHHLNGESVTFRNSVLGVLGEVLRQLPCSCEGPLLVESRDLMLQALLDHIHDIHAFVRVKALQVSLQLSSVHVIPLPVLQHLLEKTSGRLRDKSSLVRRAALHLLCAMLSSNPFASKLDKAEFAEKLAEEQQFLECCDHGDVDKKMAVVQYLKAAIDFIDEITGCIPTAVNMLRSRTASDVLESLEFLKVAKFFQIHGAEDGIRNSLSLVWSQDEQIRNGLVSTYVHLYLTAGDSSCKEHSELVLKTLIELISNVTVGQKASLENLVGLFVRGGHIPSLVVDQLWRIHAEALGEDQHSILACLLLCMTLSSNTSECNLPATLDRLATYGLVNSNGLLFASHTCSVVNKLKGQQNVGRLSSGHNLFQQIKFLLLSHFDNFSTSHWIPFCEQALNVVYSWSEHPDHFCEGLLRDLSRIVFQSGSCNSVPLSRFLFCVGHIAQCQVIHCELNISNERKELLRENKDHAAKEDANEELALGSGEDQEVDLVRTVLDVEVGGSEGMLSLYEPLLVSIISNPSKYCVRLQTAALLSLSKFMLISSLLCDKYLQLLFTVLEKSEVATIRAVLIVVASDLVCRFPNTIARWTSLMYNRLKDESILVRKNTMMVLIHLILNDMIKIRGQISTLALCLQDKDVGIKEMAQMFFYELSLKGNTLYNITPDIISQLSDPACGTDHLLFRHVVGYLFRLIKKEKQQESLIEKLCHRIRAARNEQQAEDLSYCFSLLPPTEKALLKLQENFRCYQDHLVNTAVHKHLLCFITKAKKFGKTEIKALAEELENRAKEHLNAPEEGSKQTACTSQDTSASTTSPCQSLITSL